MLPTDEKFEYFPLHGGISDCLIEEVKTNPNGAFCRIREAGDLYPPSQEELAENPNRTYSKERIVEEFKNNGLIVKTIHKPVFGEFMCIQIQPPND